MGQRLVAMAPADPELTVVAALEYAQHPRLGQDAGMVAGSGALQVPLTSELPDGVDVVIDFSTPKGTSVVLAQCIQRKAALVLATTGLTPEQNQEVLDASRRIAILRSPSMSLAVNLAMKLSQVSGRALKDHPGGVDVEILERHHRFKEDSPSGTALKFGELIAREMGQTHSQHGREGRIGQRPHHEIGYHAVRVGDNPGEHTIVFGLLGETLEITVRATNRDCYVQGALAAAKFLAGKPPGMYGMQDVLGLD
jgi:4-hydroxy-tetrahydrodipicolinate reductase